MTQAYNLSQFANFVNASGQVSAAGIQPGVVVGSGTVMLFYQSAAPTGWTQVTSLNDYALRLVSGVGGTTGGTTAYSTVFSNQTPSISVGIGSLSISATTLSASQMPAHNHPLVCDNIDGDTAFHNANAFGTATAQGFYFGRASINYLLYNNAVVTSVGGGGSHNHGLSGSPSASSNAITLNVRYANIIICSKN